VQGAGRGGVWRGRGDSKGKAGASQRVQTGPDAWFRLWTGPKARPRTGRAAGRQRCWSTTGRRRTYRGGVALRARPKEKKATVAVEADWIEPIPIRNTCIVGNVVPGTAPLYQACGRCSPD
jgi:hypothetical protein